MPEDLIVHDNRWDALKIHTATCTLCQREEATICLLGVTVGERTEQLCRTCQARIILLGVDLLRERMAKETP